MVGNIDQFSAGNLSVRPSETGVQAREGTARRIGMFFNQTAGAEQTLASETSRLAGETSQLGRETANVGAEKGAALASAGRAIGSGIAAAGDQAVKYLDNEQISKASRDFTSLMLRKTQQWNDTVKNADPNDPTVGPKFLASLNDDLEKFQNDGGYVTENAQKFVEAHANALRQHLAEKTIGDMATLAREAAVVNHQQTINQLSATVHGDPSSIDFALATLKSSTEGAISTSPNMKGTDAATARTELMQKGSEAIVKSAAIGYIEKTGKMPGWVTDPKYAPYVNGPELKMLEKAAQTQQKADMIADKQLETYRRQIQERKANDAMSKSMTDNITADENGKMTINPNAIKDALTIARQFPEAGPAQARAMIDFVQAQQNKEMKVVDDPSVVSNLSSRMFDPNNPTTAMDLMRARAKGQISDHTFTAYHSMVKELEETPLKGPIYQDTMKAAHSALVLTGVGIPGKDDVGEKNYASFVQSFIPQYLAKSRAGSLEPKAANFRAAAALQRRPSRSRPRHSMMHSLSVRSISAGMARNTRSADGNRRIRRCRRCRAAAKDG
jgi:hypothetical protein